MGRLPSPRRALVSVPRALSSTVGTTSSDARMRRRRAGLLEREASLGVLLMVPGALLLMVFMAYPFFLGIWLSLTDSMIGRMGRFVGLRSFGDPVLAISSVCLANIWRGIPFFGITILAGLQAVPNELHEAAAIDGATTWQRFRHVTVPAIKGVVLIATLLSIIWTFADFQLIYVLTKGGPANQTHIFGTYAYQIGLAATEIGTGATIALYMFPILAFFAVLLLLYLR